MLAVTPESQTATDADMRRLLDVLVSLQDGDVSRWVQLSDEMLRNVLLTVMLPRRWILLTLVIL